MTERRDPDDSGKSLPPMFIRKEQLSSKWTGCPSCRVRVKSKNLKRHVENVHHQKLEIKEPFRGLHGRKVMAIAATLLLVSTLSFYALHQPSGDEEENGAPTPVVGSWLDDYVPCYHPGSGDEDWWFKYPKQHPDSGDRVNHTDWILDSLAEKPIVILDHKEDCPACQRQMEDMEPVLKILGENVTYYDLLADGSDERANEVFDIYDANDEQHYIPLTVFLTLIEDDHGDVSVAWHSIEGATGKEWIENHMKDAIYFHRNNNETWQGD